jgi:DNA-binding response OmpR family regulator
MSSRILLVEDDPAMQLALADNLQAEGYHVLQATTCKQAREQLQQPVDLVLLDVMLPDGDGMSLCKSLREQHFKQPIILLTALGEERDRVLGLDLGADDYVSKPFGLRELLARIRAQLRKHNPAPAPSNTDSLRVGEAEVNLQAHSISRAGQPLEISNKEFELLRYLLNHRGSVVSREQLLLDVWGHKAEIETRTIDNFVVRLRKKIEVDHSKPKVLLTVHGSGYKLV